MENNYPSSFVTQGAAGDYQFTSKNHIVNCLNMGDFNECISSDFQPPMVNYPVSCYRQKADGGSGGLFSSFGSSALAAYSRTRGCCPGGGAQSYGESPRPPACAYSSLAGSSHLGGTPCVDLYRGISPLLEDVDSPDTNPRDNFLETTRRTIAEHSRRRNSSSERGKLYSPNLLL